MYGTRPMDTSKKYKWEGIFDRSGPFDIPKRIDPSGLVEVHFFPIEEKKRRNQSELNSLISVHVGPWDSQAFDRKKVVNA